jgi:hypothetical protein
MDITSTVVKADLLLALFTPERIFAFATRQVETDPFAVRRIVSCERGALFHLQVESGSVARWYVQYGYNIHGTRKSAENDECVAPLSYFCIVLLL